MRAALVLKDSQIGARSFLPDSGGGLSNAGLSKIKHVLHLLCYLSGSMGF